MAYGNSTLMNGRRVLAIALAVLIGACRGEKDDKLVVLCGSSFIPPTETLLAEFKARSGVEAIFTTGGSEDLLPNVKAKSLGDIFITHDPYLDYTKEAGSWSDHADVGFLAPVLAVAKGNPKKLASFDDLARPGLKVAISDPRYTTCGQMLEKLLDKKKIREAVMKNVENRLLKGHSALGNLVKTGAVDAAVLWNGVAHTFRDSLDVVPVPYEYEGEFRVRVIALNYTKRPGRVRAFMDFAKAEGARIFAKHGYVR
jgi:molybdate transport system substrate-binding protein